MPQITVTYDQLETLVGMVCSELESTARGYRPDNDIQGRVRLLNMAPANFDEDEKHVRDLQVLGKELLSVQLAAS